MFDQLQERWNATVYNQAVIECISVKELRLMVFLDEEVLKSETR